MKQPSEMDVLKQLAFDKRIDPGRLFVSDDVVYVMTGEDVTGTVCAVGTPFWRSAVAACIENKRLKSEIQEAIDDPRPSLPLNQLRKNNFSLPQPPGEPSMNNEDWIAHAYPLQQVTIKLQGTRHSDKAAVIGQLETVLARLKAGDSAGHDHDDDFGYTFEYVAASPGPSFFDAPAGSE